MIDTLYAIKDYNKSLPLKRRAKDSLPEIQTYNVAKINKIKKDYKKDKTELDPVYKPVGITDEGETNIFNNDKYSLSAKTRAIQRAQSQQKIDYIRTSYANLLGLTPKKEAEPVPPVGKPPGVMVPKQIDGFTKIFTKKDLDNPFSRDTWRNSISLSVYNRPRFMAERRPLTAKTKDDLIRHLPGWKYQPPKAEVGPDGEPVPEVLPEPQREPILPMFETPFQPLSKD